MDKIIRMDIWVERLSLPDIIFFIIRGIFSDTVITYDKHQIYLFARICLNLLNSIRLCRNFYPAELLLIDGKDAERKTLRYSVNRNLSGCIESLIDKCIPVESKRFKDMMRSYISGYLEHKIILITKIESEIGEKKVNPRIKNIIYLKKNHLSYLVSRFYGQGKFIVREQVNLIESLKFYIRPYGYLAILFLAKIIPFNVKSNISSIRQSVWIEFHPSFLHAFWFKAIKPLGFDIVTYLDRPDTPATPKITSELEKRRTKWIDAHLLALIKISGVNYQEIIKLFKTTLLIFFKRPVWLAIFRFEYDFLFLVYSSVFSHYKVKVLIQHQEASWKQEVQVMSMERAGGIMLGYHWSNYHFYLVSSHFFPQHVYFVWGKLMYECMQKKGNSCKYILPAGLAISSGDQKLVHRPEFSKNVNFVISIFDDSVPYPCFLSLNTLSEFYLKLLSIVKRNSNFGCIIKSRQFNLSSLKSLPLGEEIVELATMLQDENRLVCFNPALSPLEAALFSNLAVGYFVNSACAAVAVTTDCSTIQWDPAGLLNHPFYKDRRQKFIFSSLEELENAILNISMGDKTIGNYSSWRKYINYFEDTLAAKRMVNFLECLMTKSASVGNTKLALELTVKEYIEYNKVEDSFFRIDNCWKDE